MSTQEIYEELSGVWGKDCSKHTTIKTWARKFRRTRTNTCREQGSGRQKSATTHKTVDAVYDMVMCAQRVTLVQIVDALGLSYSTVNTNLQIELKVIKCVA